jgi:hypothetical protein
MLPITAAAVKQAPTHRCICVAFIAFILLWIFPTLGLLPKIAGDCSWVN